MSAVELLTCSAALGTALPAELPGYLRLGLGAEVRARTASLPSPGEGFVLEELE